MRSRTAYAAALAVVIGTGTPAAGAQTSELLAFTRNERVYFVNPDDRNELRRAPLPELPSWTPDGRRLAFWVYERRGVRRLYVATGDGTRRRQVHRGNYYYCLNPVWSPNGRKIAFTTDCDFDFMEVHVLNADGTGHKNLTPRRYAADPAWSPDGRWILYSNMRNYFAAKRSLVLYLVDPSGRKRRPIRGTYPAPFPSRLGIGPGTEWSRDGRRIFFLADGLGVINRDGSGFRKLTPAGMTVGDFELSPDGREIAVVGATGGAREIYVVNTDGTDFRRLTENRAHDMSPTWSPDSQRIAFASLRDGNWEIYVMNADGSEQRNVTKSPAQDESPVWRPRN